MENPTRVLNSFTGSAESKKNTMKMILASFVVVLMGIGTGYLLSGSSADGGVSSGGGVAVSEGQKEGESPVDESEITDSEAPIGILAEGGIDGEGTHHLERPGGPSKYVYLTSTVLDLQSFVGKKVQVQGETLSAIKAGWLMDVIKIKTVD